MYIHVVLSQNVRPPASPSVPVLPCACANLRRATRAVTRFYDRELREAGIEPTQYSLLMALHIKGEITQGALGALLALDSTTLTRVLKPLIARGWITERPGQDRRQRLLQLTGAGRRKYDQAEGHWSRAQDKLKASMGEPDWSEMGTLLARVTQISTRD